MPHIYQEISLNMQIKYTRIYYYYYKYFVIKTLCDSLNEMSLMGHIEIEYWTFYVT